MKSNDKVEFELKLGSDWNQVTGIAYAPATRDKTGLSYYQLKIRREQKVPGSSNGTTFELPLYTSDEAVVRELVRQLDQMRRSCGGR